MDFENRLPPTQISQGLAYHTLTLSLTCLLSDFQRSATKLNYYCVEVG